MPNKLVSLVPGNRTYVIRELARPNFKAALTAPGANLLPRKVVAYDTQVNAERKLEQTLLPQLDALKSAGLVTNYEAIRGTGTMVVNVPEGRAGDAFRALQGVEELGRIVKNREVTLHDRVDNANATPRAGVAEYNVSKVNAPAAWEQGVKGQGVVVGFLDTGVDAGHEALKSHYRGTAADGTVDHSYNWFDPLGGKKDAYDDHGHGSHVAGTTTGGTADKLIGVAPEAKFIAAKVFNSGGSGSTASIMKALSWMLAPTDSSGQNADPTKAPDIVSNSWGNSNGASLVYRDAVKAYQAAGIVPVFAAGNSGPREKTIGSPGSYPESITIGATDANDAAASFSSRGPSPIKNNDGTLPPKPDFAAPGVKVISAKPGGGYQAMSGTSMATPAAAGVAALLLSKYPSLSPEQVREVMAKSAVDLGTPGYDTTFGAGRIDAVAALALAAKMLNPTPPPAAA